MREKLPLVVFTLLAQAGVGLYLAAEFLGGDGFRNSILGWVLFLTAASMAVSLLHLGSPLGAYRAIYNLKSSWLSREIAYLGAFFGLVFFEFVFAFLERTGSGMPGWLAAGCGALCLFAMSSIYSHTAIPAWNGWYTHISFHSTAAILGAALYSVLALVSGQVEMAAKGTLIMAVGTGVKVLTLVVYLPTLAAGEIARRKTARLLCAYQRWLLTGELLTVTGVLGLYLVSANTGFSSGNTLPYGFLLCLTAGQLVGRGLYYATGVHIMLDQ